MNVKELQQFVRSLVRPLSVSGAKKVADDLDRMCAGLDPFQDLSIAQFTEFLARADSYARTGVVPTTGRAKAARAGRTAKVVDPEMIRAATDRMRSLYERVTSPEVDYTTIDAEIKRLDREFAKDAVLEIARGFGIAGSLKSKKAALEEIQRRMSERKESHERTQF